MNWNLLLKKSNARYKKDKEDELLKERIKILKKGEKLKKEIDKYNKSEPHLYKLKDRFYLIYPISLVVFGIWAIPIIILLFNLGNVLAMIILFSYCIITVPIGIVSLLAPTIKFFAVDLKNVMSEIKVWASAKYLIAIFFEENRLIVPIVRKLDHDGMFEFEGKPYISDKKSAFISTGKVIIQFYVKGIPNSIKFNFTKWINAYKNAKAKKPDKPFLDWEGEEMDVAFTSDNLKKYKTAKLFDEFFRDSTNKAYGIVYAVIGLAGTFCLIVLVMYILKGG